MNLGAIQTGSLRDLRAPHSPTLDVAQSKSDGHTTSNARTREYYWISIEKMDEADRCLAKHGLVEFFKFVK